jgi:hypothetical protein
MCDELCAMVDEGESIWGTTRGWARDSGGVEDSVMHITFSPRAFRDNALIVVLAESPDVVLNSKNSKSDGYGGLVSVGLILLAVVITILVFYRNRRRKTPELHQAELEEPDDKI